MEHFRVSHFSLRRQALSHLSAGASSETTLTLSGAAWQRACAAKGGLRFSPFMPEKTPEVLFLRNLPLEGKGRVRHRRVRRCDGVVFCLPGQDR